MSDIPTPRSYNQILGEMIAAFLAKYPIENLKVGGPILTMFEAAAQSDLRNTSDIFKFLASANSDTTEGEALTKQLQDEGTEWLGSTASTGYVTVGDSRYTKMASTVSVNKPAPIVGTLELHVLNAAGWPPTGKLYIGRGTTNYEGPLNYTNIVNNGSYFTVTLSAPSATKRFHNVGESVIVAQGGDRTIATGVTCTLADGSVSYRTRYPYTLLDGEVELSGVAIQCASAGTVGNAPIGAINTWSSSPFTGATVTNVLPFDNGFDAESPEQARTRLRKLRKSKAKGVNSAIEAYLAGVVADDENKRITSIKVLSREGEPTTAFIDDGTGYEERSAGVAYEVLTESAAGGEQFFQLILGRPVAKASIETSTSEPFAIVDGSVLSARVGGVLETVTFQNSMFRSPSNAEAYEVVHAINAANALFGARLSSGGTKVTIYAKADSNEDIQIASTAGVVDANFVLSFPMGLVETVALYKNDVLLSKDGKSAMIESAPQSGWAPISVLADIWLDVDGTGAKQYSFTDPDFVNAGTGYLVMAATNSLQAWAAVFNYKIPGITVSVIGNRLQMVSNLGANARGLLSITAGSLSVAMFGVASAKARSRDYTLNRNTGQLKLMAPLATGDRLTAGSPQTSAFLESSYIPGTIGLAGIGQMYFVVDSKAHYIRLPLIASTTVAEATQVIGGAAPDHLKLTSNQNIFTDVQVGDWIILTDTSLSNSGAYRVSHKPSAAEVWMAHGTPVAAGAHALLQNGITVVRTTAPIQVVTLPAGFYTAQSLATAMNALEGAHGEVVRTGYFRVIADTRDDGDVMYVASDFDARTIPLLKGVLATTNISHNAYVESTGAENSIPNFKSLSIKTGGMTDFITNDSYQDPGAILTGLRSLIYSAGNEGYGNILNWSAPVSNVVNAPLESRWYVRESSPSEVGFLALERIYDSRPFCFGPSDDLSIVIDNDINLKRFEIPLRRKVDVSQSTYTAAGMAIRDADNANQPFGKAFGSTFLFNDFALYMHPRLITDNGTAAEALWRWKELGPGGEGVVFRSEYPTQENASMSFAIEHESSTNPTVLKVFMGSVGARPGLGLSPDTRVAYRPMGAQGSLSKFYLYTGLYIRQWAVDVAGEVTLTLATPEVKTNTDINHGLQVGNTLYVNYGVGPPMVDGQIVVTGVASLGGVYTNQIKYQIGGPQAAQSGFNGGYLFFDPAGPDITWINVQPDDPLYSNGVFSYAVLDKSVYVKDKVANSDFHVLEVWAPTTGVAASNTLTWSRAVGNDLKALILTMRPLTDVNAAWPVTAIEQDGGGGMTPSSFKPDWVTAQTPTPRTRVFEDGINYVRVTTAVAAPANYSITLKAAVSANLGAYSRWGEEEAYLVPVTTDALRDFLSSTAVGGLGQNADIRSASNGSTIQIVSKTQGRSGKVEVLGGLANSAEATLVGSPEQYTTGSYITIPNSQLPGFRANWMVQLVNANGEIKPATFGYNQNLTSIVANVFTFSNDIGDYVTKANVSWQIERQGKYMAMVWNGIAPDPLPGNVEAGDYIVISNDGITDTASPSNCGIFTVVAYDAISRTYWIENPNGVEERCKASVVSADRLSVMPGDILSVGTDAWGLGNQKTFTIVIVNYGTKRAFTVAEVAAPSGAVATAQPLISLRAGSALKLVKRVTQIAPHASNPDYSVLVFNNDVAKIGSMTETNGAKVVALGKLGFASGLAVGKDGYDYNTGLIGEANRVLYGLATDPISYPGVVASGSNINISGPVVRKIEISLFLRLRNGANKKDTFDAVRTAITTFINSLPIGTQIAISDVVEVANKVGGVEAVSVASPTFTTTSDLIPVQAYEKPMVLQPDLDITLTLIQ